MPYIAKVRRLLISRPGDIPAHDLSVIREAITRWNGAYGERFGVAIIPISWDINAAAEFGGAPQDLLNKQIVDQCDICIALFANRLGTATASAESGTAEEIERLGNIGRYVAILRSRRPADPAKLDLAQAKSLDAYLEKISAKALVFTYANDYELDQRIDSILAMAVARDQGRPAIPAADVRASADPIDAGSFGLPVRSWHLNVTNMGDAPARDVRVKLESNVRWRSSTDQTEPEPFIKLLPPHAAMRLLWATCGIWVSQTQCIVSWTDERGYQQNTETLYLE